MDCDVLLLTEVPECFELAGFGVHLGERSMAAGRLSLQVPTAG
ncbi:MAG TPA: hypothetical protein VMF51_01265 [Nocardioides sp.]|nr:hypothetical protein [Nocardioides sp.]HTW13722.1 hypothetical protein [Nocardioides sp.]